MNALRQLVPNTLEKHILAWIGMGLLSAMGLAGCATSGGGFTDAPAMPAPASDSAIFEPASPPSPTPDPWAVKPGIPVPTSDGSVAIPVAPGEVGVPVPTADGGVAIPVAPN